MNIRNRIQIDIDQNPTIVITDPLPEVYQLDGAEASMGSPELREFSVCVRDNGQTADWFYRTALCNLAMYNYKLGEDARKAEAKKALTRHRNEIAEEIAKKSGWNDWAGTKYDDHQAETQEAIDMLIGTQAKP